MALDERTAKKLIVSLDRNSAALEASNKLSAAILKASGHHPNYQPPQSPQGRVDPLTELIQRGAQ